MRRSWIVQTRVSFNFLPPITAWLGWFYLQIAEERGIFAALLHPGEPPAGEIQHHNDYCPHQVQQSETPDVSCRSWRDHDRVVEEQPRRYRAEADERHKNRREMDQGNVQHVIKERHAAKGRDYTQRTPAGT